MPASIFIERLALRVELHSYFTLKAFFFFLPDAGAGKTRELPFLVLFLIKVLLKKKKKKIPCCRRIAPALADVALDLRAWPCAHVCQS